MAVGRIDKIEASGIKVNKHGYKETIHRDVKKKDFLPHDDSYIKNVLIQLKKS